MNMLEYRMGDGNSLTDLFGEYRDGAAGAATASALLERQYSYLGTLGIHNPEIVCIPTDDMRDSSP